MTNIPYHWYCLDCGMEYADDIGDCPTCGTNVCRLERDSKPDKPKPGNYYVRCGSDVQVALIVGQEDDAWSLLESDGKVVTTPGQVPKSFYSELVDADLTQEQWEKIVHARRKRFAKDK